MNDNLEDFPDLIQSHYIPAYNAFNLGYAFGDVWKRAAEKLETQAIAALGWSNA